MSSAGEDTFVNHERPLEREKASLISLNTMLASGKPHSPDSESAQTAQPFNSSQRVQPVSNNQAQPSVNPQNHTPASSTRFLDQFTTTVIGPLTVHSTQRTPLGVIKIHQDQTARIPIAGFQELGGRTYPATEVMINTGGTSGPRLYYIVFLDPANEDSVGVRERMGNQSTVVMVNGQRVWIVVLEKVEEGFVVDAVSRGRGTPQRREGLPAAGNRV